MAESKVKRLLSKTTSATPDIEALALVSTDGLPIETLLPTGMEEDRVAAMGAALLSLGERAAEELDRGKMEQVLVRAENGDVILTAVGEDALLLSLMKKDAKLGMIFITLKKLTGELKKII
jgi:predicted regulator of Ras-like GTPase activity (Roadblock/LC7/MglB family)